MPRVFLAKLRRALLSLLVLLAGFLGQPSTSHAEAVLNDWCFNLSGDTTSACNPATTATLPASVNAQNFDLTLNDPPGTSNQLGTVAITLSPGSNQSVIAYMDYDLNFANSGPFQDFGSVHGVLPTGISYELADPSGSIFGDLLSGTLTDTNQVGTGSTPPGPCCDVAWALGLSGINVTGPPETLYFTVSATQPSSGFYLEQTNLQDNESIYLSVSTSAPVAPVPLPASLWPLASALGVLAIMHQKRASLGAVGKLQLGLPA